MADGRNPRHHPDADHCRGDPHGPAAGKPRADLTSLRTLYLAGEPLDNATDEWVAAQLRVPCENHYWQTESGWPLLAGSGRALCRYSRARLRWFIPPAGKPARRERRHAGD
ncbi:hypothetical protein LNP26_30110 [Klebsiella variicola subsp. variicola]|nr:hypothetical protein [Klebsiella variicola subsp. variicola]